jgi:hypothetical protein
MDQDQDHRHPGTDPGQENLFRIRNTALIAKYSDGTFSSVKIFQGFYFKKCFTG